MRFSTSLAAVLLALSQVGFARLSFKAGKAVVSGADSTAGQTTSITSSDPKVQIKLGSHDILKLSFTVFDDQTNKDVQPHQTFLRVWDDVTREEGILPIKVSKDGKAKFSMNLRKPPVGLPPSGTNPLKVTLILGSFTHESAKYSLFDLTLPPSATVPPHPEESTFHVQPEIEHTFRPEQKLPPKTISLVFAGIVAAPWLFLLPALSQLPISLSPSARTLPFLALLASCEGLLFWYWVDLYLGQVLLYGSILGLFTAIAGKYALSSA